MDVISYSIPRNQWPFIQWGNMTKHEWSDHGDALFSAAVQKSTMRIPTCGCLTTWKKTTIWGWFIIPIRPVILVVLEIGTTLTLFFHWLSHVVFFKFPWTGPTPSPYQDLLASSQASRRIGCCGFEARAERTDEALLQRHSLGFAGFADAWAWIRGSMQYRSLGKKSI